MIKVLIVDDERLIREVLVTHLPWNQFGQVEIREADDGINGFNAYTEFKPDIIISDIKMPRMSGIEMAEKIFENYNTCKFIFLSGYTDKEYFKSAIKLKAVSYVEKPIDLNEITLAIQMAIDDLENQKALNSNIKPVMLKDIALSLIYQKSIKDEYSNILKNLGIDFPEEGRYFTSVISIQSLDDNQKNYEFDFRDEFISVIKPIFKSTEKKMLIAYKDTDYIVIHFNCEDEDSFNEYKELFNILENIFPSRNSISDYCFSIGVGSLIKGIKNIYLSYETGVVALKQCFFKGLNKVNFYKELSVNSYVFDENKLIEFTEYIKKLEITQAIFWVKRIINEMKESENTHPKEIKNIFQQIILKLVRIAEDRNEVFLLEYCKTSIDEINKSLTLSLIEDIVIDTIKIFAQKLGSNENKDVISGINSFILSNYANLEFNLNTIAEKLFLTTNYLCFIYKKETGKTINRFLTEVRIEKAKELLRTTDYKLYQIAKMVGYQDGKYFNKVFLKIVGMKPRDYRERQRNV